LALIYSQNRIDSTQPREIEAGPKRLFSTLANSIEIIELEKPEAINGRLPTSRIRFLPDAQHESIHSAYSVARQLQAN
jgi:hypothetical protein